MCQTKHKGKDSYDKTMSPKSPKQSLEENKFYDLSTRFKFYSTPHCKNSLLSSKAKLEFTKNVMFTAIKYVHDNRIFGFT